ncbi:hypothetical protein JTE90_018957 [Oedothorax gibbosus]|uniref:Membrane-associated tyrosine- and threonine-specific cdc2-inhibitory kinase n=1 Tax=Oedothorax gibbosus TaxID=931172 RepID=A0AAV6V200_9ARAC|nr:hypothetical protein JTE90_018957 [Oedothorax gibbosus]
MYSLFISARILRSRILSIRDEDSGARNTDAKSPLPTPKFFSEQSFSSKKDKTGPRPVKPPPTPRPRSKLQYNSCPSIGRLFSHGDSGLRQEHRTENPNQAQSISFRDSNSSLSSKYDSTSDKLYFHQCFQILDKLGSGSFGDVFKVKCKEDGKLYAVKRAKEKFAGIADRQRKLQEVQKHEQLPSHPNCVKFYKAWEERQHLYIQTELCSKSLSEYADEHHHIPEEVIWNYLIDLLLAVKHLHDHNLVHLDIKPDNIFVSKDGENVVCKLGDFGLVLDLSKSDTSDALEGDPRYIAPELMQGVFTKSADIFSLGITILELASDLDLPRGDEAWHQLRNLEIPEQFIQGLSFELIEVISRMMEPDYVKRPCVDEILEMESINRVYRQRKKQPMNHKETVQTPNNSKASSSGWCSSLSDDVFDQDSNASFNRSLSQSRFVFEEDRSFTSGNRLQIARTRLGASTPCGFRYFDSKTAHDTSGSPNLSESRKKCHSPSAEISPTYRKSPRLQLFNSSSSDEEEVMTNCLPKNLMCVFDSLSPSQ